MTLLEICAPSSEPSAACIAAKAHLGEVAAHDRESSHAFYKEVTAGAGIGCVGAIVTTDTVTLGGGIPFFAGECAVGGIGGGLTATGVYAITNFGPMISNSVADVQAIVDVVKACK